MSKKVICILSDALCNEYINDFDMKNLRKIIQKESTTHIPKIYPSTGYCEIVEYVTGQDSDEHMMFTQVNINSNWKQMTHPRILDILDLLYRRNILRKIPKIRGVIRIIFEKFVENILAKYIDSKVINVKYNIPYSSLYYMEAIESIYEYDSYEFGGDKNIFINLKEKGISYDIEDFVKFNKIYGSDLSRLNRLEEKINKQLLKDFTLLYIGYGEIAHFTGKSHKNFITEMQNYDKKLGVIKETLESKYDDYDFIILGDHGMIDIKEYVDVQTIFKQTIEEYDSKLKEFDDYIYFIDSTMFRVWFKDKDISNAIEYELEKKLKKYLELDDSSKKYLTQFQPMYGDIVLLIKSDYVFFPDFYNLKPNLGMHGYLNHYAGQQGTMIHLTSDDNKKAELIEQSHLSSMKKYILSLWDKHAN